MYFKMILYIFIYLKLKFANFKSKKKSFDLDTLILTSPDSFSKLSKLIGTELL